jgi:hypothetical protein
VARISGHLLQGLGTGAEQEVIENLLVLQRQWGELVRESEDNMDIGNRQKFVLTSQDPFVASATLTLGAMAIAAANGEIPISCLMESNLYWGVRSARGVNFYLIRQDLNGLLTLHKDDALLLS